MYSIVKDEVDCIKIISCVKDEVNCLKIICNETDIFDILTVYVFWKGCKLNVLMEAFDTSQSLIDINEPAKKHAETLPIGAHALSCWLIASCYGVNNANSLSEVRFSVLKKLTKKKLPSTPKL